MTQISPMTEKMYNTYSKGLKKEDGQRNPVTKETKNDRSTRNKDTKTTGVDNAEHLIGQDNIYAQQELWNAATVEKKATTKKCEDSRRRTNTWIKLHLQSRKTTGITTKYRVSATTRRKEKISSTQHYHHNSVLHSFLFFLIIIYDIQQQFSNKIQYF